MDAKYIINYNRVAKVLILISLVVFLIIFSTKTYDSCRICSIDYKEKSYNGIEIYNTWYSECRKLYLDNNLDRLRLEDQKLKSDKFIKDITMGLNNSG